jgi:hypothetical protein
MSWSLIQGVLPIVEKIDQKTEMRRGPTRAVEPFKKSKNKNKTLSGMSEWSKENYTILRQNNRPPLRQINHAYEAQLDILNTLFTKRNTSVNI